MAITDELREYTERLDDLFNNLGMVCRMLLAIADRIDTEHESEISRAAQLLADAEKDRDFNYANWQDCKQKVLQHNITIDELDAEIERLKDALARCIALPVDADGVTIHVGERVQLIGNDPSTVSHMSLADDGWRVYVKYDGGIGTGSGEPKLIHHYHAPTVEDVLREFAAEFVGMANHVDDHEVTDAIEMYASKLRLAGDAE